MDEREYEEKSESIELLEFCKTPRTRKEIAEHLGLASVSYAMQTYIAPLLDDGRIAMSNPDKPRSTKQKYYTI